MGTPRDFATLLTWGLKCRPSETDKLCGDNAELKDLG